jgi:hypothetical protein
MKNAHVIALMALFAAVSGIVGFLIGVQAKRPQMLQCTVARVVDDVLDEPSAIVDYPLPYTILTYEPKWEVFHVPGVIDEPGRRVWFTPPADR